MKKVYLDKLKRNKNGGIDWKDSVGLVVPFQYDDIKGEIKIISYNSKTQYLKIEYDGKVYKKHTNTLVNCTLGEILNKINKKYKYNIGDIVNGLVIIDQTRNVSKNGCTKRGYTVKCLTDGYINKNVSEYTLKAGVGCPVCDNKIVVSGINDVATTRPDLVKYFKNISDAKLYTKGSDKVVKFSCPICGFEKSMKVNDLSNQGFGCSMCSDGVSYPNKFVQYFLFCIGADFVVEKKFRWSNNRRYDIYIPSLNCIIENNGKQHYDLAFGDTIDGARKVKDEQINDKLKRDLALSNGIKHYVVLDCRKSRLDWIKNSIMNSELPNLLNFKEEDIDWKKCGECAANNILKEVCETFNKGNKTIQDIADEFKIHYSTARGYLKTGKRLGICDYDGKYNQIKIKYDEEEHTISEWCDILGLKYVTVQKRYRKGLTPKECLSNNDLGNTIIEEHNGIKLSLKGWAKSINVPYSTFLRVYHRNNDDINETLNVFKN